MGQEVLDWYSVKGVFRWYFKDTKETVNFEDRTVLFQASSFDQALDMAAEESIEYCEEDTEANFLIESLDVWKAYLISENTIEHGVEIFSGRSDSQLTKERYLEKYHSVNDS